MNQLKKITIPTDRKFWPGQVFLLASSIAHMADNYKSLVSDRWANASVHSFKTYILKKTIEGYANLALDWDGYNANAISVSSINIAQEILFHLANSSNIFNEFEINVFPMRDGGIQFEFDADHTSAELEVSPKGKVTMLSYNNEGDLIRSVEINNYELSEVGNLLEDEICAA